MIAFATLVVLIIKKK
ncbi:MULTISPECIES: hypothetical protein [Sporomusaceae]|nr:MULTISPECIES: hypothetical protein [Sporomusaceae]MCM0760798.1 hypothetical protein [Sporomusa sphaeroides DSM 2875]